MGGHPYWPRYMGWRPLLSGGGPSLLGGRPLLRVSGGMASHWLKAIAIRWEAISGGRPSLVGGRPSLLGWRPLLFGGGAIAIRWEVISIRLEAIPIGLEAIARCCRHARDLRPGSRLHCKDRRAHRCQPREMIHLGQPERPVTSSDVPLCMT